MRASADRYLAHRDRWAFEAFLIHVRVLRSFFLDAWSDRHSWASTAIVAELYFSECGLWRRVKGATAVHVLTATKESLDSQLAHLSTRRAEAFKELEQQVSALRAELDALWRAFLKEVSKHRDTRAFEKAVAEKQLEMRP